MKIKNTGSIQEKLAVQLHRIGNLFYKIHRMDGRIAYSERVGNVSLHRGQGRVLALLNSEGDLSVGQLVEQLDVRPSTGGELIAKLEQNGYVTRAQSSEDKRVSVISITDEGKEMLEETARINEAYLEEMFAGLAPEDQKQLSELLDKLMDSIKVRGVESGAKMGDPSRRRKGRHSGGHQA